MTPGGSGDWRDAAFGAEAIRAYVIHDTEARASLERLPPLTFGVAESSLQATHRRVTGTVTVFSVGEGLSADAIGGGEPGTRTHQSPELFP